MSRKEVMEYFFNIKNFKSCAEVMEYFFNTKNFKNRKAKQKVVLFPEIGRVKIYLSLTRPCNWMCIKIYIFKFKTTTTTTATNTSKKEKRKKNKNTKKAKNFKKEKRISPENRLKNTFEDWRFKILLVRLSIFFFFWPKKVMLPFFSINNSKIFDGVIFQH